MTTTEKELIRQLADALRIREVWFDRRNDHPPTCFDCELQEVRHTGWGWLYQHASDCKVRRLLETADEQLKEPAA